MAQSSCRLRQMNCAASSLSLACRRMAICVTSGESPPPQLPSRGMVAGRVSVTQANIFSFLISTLHGQQ